MKTLPVERILTNVVNTYTSLKLSVIFSFLKNLSLGQRKTHHYSHGEHDNWETRRQSEAVLRRGEDKNWGKLTASPLFLVFATLSKGF